MKEPISADQNSDQSTKKGDFGRSITYVLDTNVLIDYPEIIPGGTNFPLEDQSIDFTGAHIVIPTAVIRELGNHKKEQSDRGVACRTVLKRLRELEEQHDKTMFQSCNLENPILIRDGKTKLSVFNAVEGFKRFLPFSPASTDMDGQIILATLAVTYLKNGLMTINEKGIVVENCDKCVYPTMQKGIEKNFHEKVILLTSDNELIIRAHARGIETSRFSYKIPAPYTGRRDLVVPPDMFESFFLDRYLERSVWEAAMPSEPPLVDNEFIVMYPEDDIYPGAWNFDTDTIRFANIGRYDASSQVIFPLTHFRKLDVDINNPGQAIYAEVLMDPDISAVICTGPAGTGKTYMATVFAYIAYKSGLYDNISVVPCQTENTYGYLPGDLNEKLDPNVRPIKRAIRNYLLSTNKKMRQKQQTTRKFGNTDAHLDEEGERKVNEKSLHKALDEQVQLIWDNWFGPPIPIENARGEDFHGEIALFDEFQDQNRTQAMTLLTRLGTGGKMIITGDIEQIHAAYLDRDNNGLTFARNLLKGLPGVAQVTFLESEVIRSPLVSAIIKRQSSST